MKFSIVTPSFNSERFISETIESVLSQKGDFEIEYIIVDGLSSDNTIPIIRKYQCLLNEKHYNTRCNAVSLTYVSEEDDGMYAAINRGFSIATGDVYAWINSDDIYLPGAFDVMAKSFQTYSEIRWLKGITCYMNQFSTIIHSGHCFVYNQRWIQMGMYGRELYFIQQDSVFWRSDLWKKAGRIDSDLKRAGDYSLWIKYAHYTPLYTVKAYVSCFRKLDGQISEDMDAYRGEYAKILIPLKHDLLKRRVKLFFACINYVPVPFLRKFLCRICFGQQSLLLELTNKDQPVLKQSPYHVVDK